MSENSFTSTEPTPISILPAELLEENVDIQASLLVQQTYLE